MKSALPASYRVYAQLRQGVRSDAGQLGQGRNLLPLPTAVSAALADPTLHDRLTSYASSVDAAEDAAMARVLSRVLGLRDVRPDDVLVTDGATQGVSTVFAALERDGCAVALPLPTYFGFELSALRHSIPVSSFYRPDTGASLEMHATGARPTLLLEMIPNGFTGSLISKPATRCRPTLTLVDAVFLIGSGSAANSTWRQLADRDLHDTVLALTVSKDLSSPGLRAGLLVTKHPAVKDAARLNRLESTYSTSVLARRVVLLYLLAAGAHELRLTHGLSSAEAAAAVLEVADSNAVPGAAALIAVLEHFDRMVERYTANAAIAIPTLARSGAVATMPDVGYSTLVRLPPEVERQSGGDVVGWVNRMGRERGLKLNPSLLFGGDRAVWRSLYGSEFFVRLNLSDEPRRLRAALRCLVEAIDDGSNVAHQA